MENLAKQIVQYYRSQCPRDFDPVCMGGGQPSVPKPPAPPTTTDAAQAARDQLNKRKPKGFESTILGGGMGDTSKASVVQKSLLGA